MFTNLIFIFIVLDMLHFNLSHALFHQRYFEARTKQISISHHKPLLDPWRHSAQNFQKYSFVLTDHAFLWPFGFWTGDAVEI